MSKEYSDQTSIIKLYLLMFLTMGLYSIYWYISNTHKLKDNSKKDDLISLKIFGIFIPIVNFYFLWDFFESVRKEANKSGIDTSWKSEWILAGVIFLGGVINGIYKELLGIPGGFLALLFYVLFILALTYPLEFVQDTLNDYLEQKEKKRKLKIKHLPNSLEILFILASWIFMYLIIIVL